MDSTGNLTIAGTITTQASGFDIAESYPTNDQNIEAGDVIAIDKTHSGKIEKATQPYQNTVIGIITTKPGLTLTNETMDGKDVALAGRVPVKITTENGEVKAGDYLTSSSLPGYAQKATRAGIVIGKALENFDCHPEASAEGSQILHSVQNDNTICQGTIMMFINISWYDPGVYFTADGALTTLPITSDGGRLSLRSLDSSEVDASASQSAIASSSASVISDLSSFNSQLSDDPLFKDLLTRYDALTARLDALQSVVIGTSTDASGSASIASSSAILGSPAESGINSATPGSRFARDSGQSQNDIIPASSSAELLAAIKDVPLFASDSARLSGSLTVSGRTTLADLGVTGNISAGLLSINGMDCSSSAVAHLPGEPTDGSHLEGENACGASINTLAGSLYLQNQGLGGIDILAGKIRIDTSGNLVSEATITAKEVTAEKVTTNKLVITEPVATQSAVLSASDSALLNTQYSILNTASPSAILARSAGSVIIKAGQTTVEVKTSAITDNSLVFVTPDKPLATSGKVKDNTTITISIPTPTPEDVKVNWWIIN